MRFLTFIRLLPALVLFGIASLALLPAPTHLLWMAAIGATELGHALSLICIAASVGLWSNAWPGRVATGLCLAAAAIALTPLLRASQVAHDLPANLAKAFGEAQPRKAPPLSYFSLFRGTSTPNIKAETFIYKRVEDAELLLDFYPAQSSSASPVIVDIHGGSWQSGDNKDFVAMNRYFAGLGFAVAALTYRLAPRWRYPAASDDVRSAISFLRSQATALNIDPNRIVLLGRSAGGQIALDVAYSEKDPGIRGVIAFYAPSDLFWSWENPGNPLVIDTRSVLRLYLGGGPSEVATAYGAASAIQKVSRDVPPTLLFHGGRDELVSPHHSVMLDERLAEAGVPHLNVAMPWATHGFDYFLSGPGGQISAYAIEHFLDRFCGREELRGQ